MSKRSPFDVNFYFLVSELSLPRELGRKPIAVTVGTYIAFFNEDLRMSEPRLYLLFFAIFSTSTAKVSNNAMITATKLPSSTN